MPPPAPLPDALRLLVFLSTLIALWLVVLPASASLGAPICDPRGAIGFAPPPQVQDLELSLDVPPDCVEVDPLETKNIEKGHPHGVEYSASQEPAHIAPVVLPSLHVQLIELPRFIPPRGPRGAALSIDRPPRA